jgi:hypothetical protein
MRTRNLVAHGAAMAVAAFAAHVYWRHYHRSRDPVVHVENGFEFTAHGPYDKVAPLFGGWRELACAGGHWNPQFLYPTPVKDVRGEVFTVAHGHARSTWINTAFDLDAGHVQYVYVIPDAQAVVIDVRLTRKDASNTGVKVIYEVQGLTGTCPTSGRKIVRWARSGRRILMSIYGVHTSISTPSFCLLTDVKQNPNAGESHEDGRAAVRNERQRDTFGRHESQNYADVDEGLNHDHASDSHRKQTSERVLGAHGGADAAP